MMYTLQIPVEGACRSELLNVAAEREVDWRVVAAQALEKGLPLVTAASPEPASNVLPPPWGPASDHRSGMHGAAQEPLPTTPRSTPS
jgi:hypothetical protein